MVTPIVDARDRCWRRGTLETFVPKDDRARARRVIGLESDGRPETESRARARRRVYLPFRSEVSSTSETTSVERVSCSTSLGVARDDRRDDHRSSRRLRKSRTSDAESMDAVSASNAARGSSGSARASRAVPLARPDGGTAPSSPYARRRCERSRASSRANRSRVTCLPRPLPMPRPPRILAGYPARPESPRPRPRSPPRFAPPAAAAA